MDTHVYPKVIKVSHKVTRVDLSWPPKVPHVSSEVIRVYPKVVQIGLNWRPPPLTPPPPGLPGVPQDHQSVNQGHSDWPQLNPQGLIQIRN